MFQTSSKSSDQARPSLPMLRVLICVSGLKCCSLKVRPFAAQFVPSASFDKAVLSICEAACAAVSSVIDAAMPTAIARSRAAIPTDFIDSLPWMTVFSFGARPFLHCGLSRADARGRSPVPTRPAQHAAGEFAKLRRTSQEPDPTPQTPEEP